MEIVKIFPPENARIICISDIHGCYSAFEALLKKCGYNEGSDYLFILGDLTEKGKENIAVIRRIMALCKEPKVICIKGNNDTMCTRMAFFDEREKFFRRLERRPFNCYMEMAQTLGLTQVDFENNFEESREKVSKAFEPELRFMRNLPLTIETDDYIFIHAGIENRPDWQNTPELFALTVPWFFNGEHRADKTVVCGHYPTYNFEAANNTNLPIIDENKKIICIDGGAATKYAGQLNAFIINGAGNGAKKYEVLFEPVSPKKTVKRSVFGEIEPIYVDWEKYDFTVIGKEKDFLRVKINQTGEIGLISEKHCAEWDGKLHGWTNLNVFLSAKEGEEFAAADETEEYYFGIAENGQVGFAPKSCF